MKLTELEPRWASAYAAPEGTKQGITFLCPHCRVVRLAVFFDAPICGSPAVDIKQLHRDISEVENHPLRDVHVGAVLWHREGDSFETLTLTPSIDASRWGCWHGFITGGEVR